MYYYNFNRYDVQDMFNYMRDREASVGSTRTLINATRDVYWPDVTHGLRNYGDAQRFQTTQARDIVEFFAGIAWALDGTGPTDAIVLDPQGRDFTADGLTTSTRRVLGYSFSYGPVGNTLGEGVLVYDVTGGSGVCYYLGRLKENRVEISNADGLQPGTVEERIDNLVIVRPDAEHLQTLPERARNFALAITQSVAGDDRTLVGATEDGWTTRRAGTATYPTVETILANARTAYREWLRISIRQGGAEDRAAEEERRRVAREASAQRFAAFARRPIDETQRVPTLPFVPHGLASSRRWGIEVESGGARGVDAPDQWRRIGDGSLRSAYDGYTEVQDFEPYDEEVTEYIRWNHCALGNNHSPDSEVYNESTGRYEWTANEDYVDPRECEGCGEVTRIEHRVPQTITHRAQGGDCAEFVSPILVSMHSKGLHALTEQLAVRPQNDSAGVHVHVEASDLTPDQVATLIFGYDILEPILESSYQRGGTRRYCARREPEDVLRVARKLRTPGSLEDHEVRDGTRYVTLNTTALNDHGTIEFRAMGAVYNYDYLVRWAMLCRELVNIVANGVTTAQFSRVKSWQDLLMLLAAYGKEYVRAAAWELTGDAGEVPALIKEGSPLTTEALDADLSAIMNDVVQSTLTARESLDEMRDALRAFAARDGRDLVGVGTSTGGTWMV